jgi:hypothetical protein
MIANAKHSKKIEVHVMVQWNLKKIYGVPIVVLLTKEGQLFAPAKNAQETYINLWSTHEEQSNSSTPLW